MSELAGQPIWSRGTQGRSRNESVVLNHLHHYCNPRLVSLIVLKIETSFFLALYLFYLAVYSGGVPFYNLFSERFLPFFAIAKPWPSPKDADSFPCSPFGLFPTPHILWFGDKGPVPTLLLHCPIPFPLVPHPTSRLH